MSLSQEEYDWVGFTIILLFMVAMAFCLGYMYAEVRCLGRLTTDAAMEVEELERDIQALDKEVNK